LGLSCEKECGRPEDDVRRLRKNEPLLHRGGHEMTGKKEKEIKEEIERIVFQAEKILIIYNPSIFRIEYIAYRAL